MAVLCARDPRRSRGQAQKAGVPLLGGGGGPGSAEQTSQAAAGWWLTATTTMKVSTLSFRGPWDLHEGALAWVDAWG